MQRVYQDDPYRQELETAINEALVFQGRTELACEDLLFHPAGGGQPDDFGNIVVNGKTHRVTMLRKHKGETRIVIDDDGSAAAETGFGDTAICKLDWERRNRLMRLHSAAHVLMASARKLVKGYVPGGMEIFPDLTAATIRFQREQEPNLGQLEEVSKLANEIVQHGHEIASFRFPNLDAARNEGKDLFRMDPSVQLKGEVRIVRIDGIDFNPCSGTHVRNTTEIGAIISSENRSVDQALTEMQYSISNS